LSPLRLGQWEMVGVSPPGRECCPARRPGNRTSISGRLIVVSVRPRSPRSSPSCCHCSYRFVICPSFSSTAREPDCTHMVLTVRSVPKRPASSTLCVQCGPLVVGGGSTPPAGRARVAGPSGARSSACQSARDRDACATGAHPLRCQDLGGGRADAGGQQTAAQEFGRRIQAARPDDRAEIPV
jgi:hypothetical protein